MKKNLVVILSVALVAVADMESKGVTSQKVIQHKKISADTKNSPVVALKPLYLDDNLERFLTESTSDVEEQRAFRGYYSKFIKKQNRRHMVRKRRKLQNLRTQALDDIEVQSPAIYAQLEPYLVDLDESPECRPVRLYLVRHALFQEFKEQRALGQLSVWGKTKKYAQKAGSKVMRFGKRVASKFSVSRS